MIGTLTVNGMVLEPREIFFKPRKIIADLSARNRVGIPSCISGELPVRKGLAACQKGAVRFPRPPRNVKTSVSVAQGFGKQKIPASPCQEGL